MTSFVAALSEAREKRATRGAAKQGPVALAEVPADAEFEGDAVLYVWADNKFIPYAKWLASAPISSESVTAADSAIPRDATCVTGDCKGTQVRLVRDGDRWLMFAGSRGAARRRRDFASPFLGHAIRTAEFWYGSPANGWRVEGKSGSANGGGGTTEATLG
jgi:hypothetical protein